MKRLILTSSTHTVSDHWVQHLDLKKENKLAFITTPADAEEGDRQWLMDDRDSLVAAGLDVTDYSIENKNAVQLLQDLSSYDIIYVSGGNTFFMLQQSHVSGFFEVVHTLVEEMDKIYVGTSAGSIIAGPQLPEYLLDLGEKNIDDAFLNAAGYGFVNFIVLPHWGSDDFKKRYLEGRLQLMYHAKQFPVLVLTNHQYVKIIDDSIEIIDTTKRN
ncbi:MAG: Type 1 glutamine amidotransferase-like domain-containing protein [Pseudomonadales bacterium]|nr:Type 1 glutamine amidotransferase-like domain-containing protein [Candidatus Woesebacteria bacterium]MCB9800873.1 Type 1 glutamine amidotransferase-like domain-containing protein [Pseudomonadales bacterium]